MAESLHAALRVVGKLIESYTNVWVSKAIPMTIEEWVSMTSWGNNTTERGLIPDNNPKGHLCVSYDIFSVDDTHMGPTITEYEVMLRNMTEGSRLELDNVILKDIEISIALGEPELVALGQLTIQQKIVEIAKHRLLFRGWPQEGGWTVDSDINVYNADEKESDGEKENPKENENSKGNESLNKNENTIKHEKSQAEIPGPRNGTRMYILRITDQSTLNLHPFRTRVDDFRSFPSLLELETRFANKNKNPGPLPMPPLDHAAGGVSTLEPREGSWNEKKGNPSFLWYSPSLDHLLSSSSSYSRNQDNNSSNSNQKGGSSSQATTTTTIGEEEEGGGGGRGGGEGEEEDYNRNNDHYCNLDCDYYKSAEIGTWAMKFLIRDDDDDDDDNNNNNNNNRLQLMNTPWFRLDSLMTYLKMLDIIRSRGNPTVSALFIRSGRIAEAEQIATKAQQQQQQEGLE